MSFLKSLLGGGSSSVTLEAVPIQRIETSTDRRARRLKHLIKANHANHAILYANLTRTNRLAHALGSAYLLGATAEHLNNIYDVRSKTLEPWSDAPAEISLHDWTDFLGKREYQRAFIDFFEDELVQHNYDVKAMVHHFLFESSPPLINNVMCASGHAAVHLAYGYELDSKDIMIEALSLISSTYDFLHKYSEEPEYSNQKGSLSSDSILDIFEAVRQDSRLDGIVPPEGDTKLEGPFEEQEGVILEYWNAWQITDLNRDFRQSQQAAVSLLTASGHHDDCLVHALTSSHAVRVLLPIVPTQYQIPLVRQWWLFTLATYIARSRPRIDADQIEAFDLSGRDWKYVEHAALNGPHALSGGYVKAIRSIKSVAETWGDRDGAMLKAGVKFASEFDGWKNVVE